MTGEALNGPVTPPPVPAHRRGTVSAPVEDLGGGNWALRPDPVPLLSEALDDRDRARRVAVALEQECAALVDALGAVTHDHESRLGPQVTWSMAGPVPPDPCRWCGTEREAAVHLTPAVVRAELEGGVG